MKYLLLDVKQPIANQYVKRKMVSFLHCAHVELNIGTAL